MNALKRSALAVSLVALGAAACASPPAPPLAEALKGAEHAPRACPHRLAVAPIEVLPEAVRPPADPREWWTPVPADLPGLRAKLESVVRASGAFAEVRFLEKLAGRERGAAPPAGAVAGGAGIDGAEDAVPWAPEPAPLEEVLEAAHALDLDLVLTMKLKRHAVRYVGRNGRFVPSVVLFILLGWPSWLIADEQYAGELEVVVEIRGVGSERVVWTRTLSAGPPATTMDLGAFDRGWMLTGTLSVPSWLEKENYGRAGEAVLPPAVNQVSLALARDLASLPAETETEAFKRGLAHGLALVVGAARYANKVNDLRYAVDDAQGLAKLLLDRERGGLARRNVTVLAEAEPAKARVLEALDERVRRAGPLDTLYVYFSGLGFEAAGDAWLAPTDIDPTRPLETAIPLAEVAKRLDRCPARQVLILDTSFGPEGAPGVALRTIRREYLTGLAGGPSASPDPAAARAALDRLATGKPRRTVLLAAAPGANVAEISPVVDDKMGLLTARLLDAARAPGADADRSGTVTLEEAFEAAKREVVKLSGRTALAQTPQRLGADGKDVVLARVAGTK